MSDRTETLIESLARDLPPVKPIPPLRRMAAGVAGLALVSTAAGVAWLGINPRLAEDAARYPSFGVIAAGLVGVCLGGVVAGLAASVPGREREARAAGMLLAAGALVAVVLGGWLGLAGPEADLPRAPASQAGMCLYRGIGLGVPAALLGFAFVLRGAAARPRVALAAAAAGACALGALGVHLSCVQMEATHLLVAHALAPALGAALLALLLGALLRRVLERG